MTSTIGRNPRPSASYITDNSLLFQFILIEFIEAFSEVQRLDVLCHRKPSTLSDASGKGLDCETTRKTIETILTKLAGSARDYMRLFSWNFGDGLLGKLKTNCSLFIHNAVSDEKEMIALQHYADKMWQGCLQATDSFREEVREYEAFFSAVDKTSNSMQRFAKQMARIALQFREDENVVFCILRYKESLDKLYGSRFVAKLLCRMFPKGMRDALNFLSQRYAERGFENVLPVLAEKISELEMSAL